MKITPHNRIRLKRCRHNIYLFYIISYNHVRSLPPDSWRFVARGLECDELRVWPRAFGEHADLLGAQTDGDSTIGRSGLQRGATFYHFKKFGWVWFYNRADMLCSWRCIKLTGSAHDVLLLVLGISNLVGKLSSLSMALRGPAVLDE